MDPLIFSSTTLYSYVLLPLLIFFARVCDVSLGTLRIVFISKGLKYLAPMIGFVEVLIWLLAIGQIMQNLTNAYYYLFYAGGFATGNYVGILLEEKLSLGIVAIRIITKKEAEQLTSNLKEHNYGLSVMDGMGANGPIKIIFTVTSRQNIDDVIQLVKHHNPSAFYSIEDIRYVNEAMIPHDLSLWKRSYHSFFKRIRKGK
jgi:uncharacterized protein YebE (UPF0316 family)